MMLANVVHMAHDTTLRQREEGIPIAGIVATVLEGPDRGRSCASLESLAIGTAKLNDLVLTDKTISRHHVELLRKSDRILVRDQGSTNGTFYASAAVREVELVGGGRLRLGNTTIQVSDGQEAFVEVHGQNQVAGLLGQSTCMRQLMARVQRIAQSDASALILGETGSGKEVVARAIHGLSTRAEGPFEPIDCGAMSPTLIASELFGHERGAFTGAAQRHVGIFERAEGGTVFLDEIGELPLELQAALLGALERRSFRRLGGTAVVPINVRVICATNRDLRAEVNAGTFRQDLYFRIAVVMVRLPPLREHVEDIPLLAAHFLRAAGHQGPVEDVLTPSVLERLMAHRWPGNVRELRNAVEAMLTMGEPFSVDADQEPMEDADDDGVPFADAREFVLNRFEESYIRRLLKQTEGNVSQGARLAQLSRSHLVRLISKHGIRFRREPA